MYNVKVKLPGTDVVFVKQTRRKVPPPTHYSCSIKQNGYSMIARNLHLFQDINSLPIILDVTEDPSALNRWMVAGPEDSRLVALYDAASEAKGITQILDNRHHKQTRKVSEIYSLTKSTVYSRW